MKPILCTLTLLIALSATVPAANGPTDKGSMIIGGSAYYLAQNGDAYRDTWMVSIAPTVGLFVSRGILLGVEAEWSYMDSRSGSGPEYSFGPAVGYYFNVSPERSEAKGAFYPFLSAFAGYGGIGSYPTVIRFGGQIGAKLMLSNSVGLDMSVRASHDIWNPDERISVTGFSALIGFGITSFIY